MCLIFDDFLSVERARRFAAAVSTQHGLRVHVVTEEAQSFNDLATPFVLVARTDRPVEDLVIGLVADVGGRFSDVLAGCRPPCRPRAEKGAD